jgi:hypothetical protein
VWLDENGGDDGLPLRCPHVLEEISFDQIRADIAAARRGATIPLPRENMR